MQDIIVKSKKITAERLDNRIVQNERSVEVIRFSILDETPSGLYFYLIYSYEDSTGGVEPLTESDGKYVWTPSHEFTAQSGRKRIQIIAVDEDNYSTGDVVTIRWSTISACIIIPADVEVDEPADTPQQSVIEDLICEEINA